MCEVKSADAESAAGVLKAAVPGDLRQSAIEDDVKGGKGRSKDQEPGALPSEAKKRSLSFYLSVLLLGVVGFLVALDANSLAVALPVSSTLNAQG